MISVPVRGISAEGLEILAKDMAYPTLVREVLPTWLTGFFGAVLFGAVMSSFNSGVNSLSTLVSLDIYKGIINKDASDRQTVRIGKIFGSITIAICVCIAPLIAQADGLYTLMRTIMAVINVPILTVILVGIVSKRTPALAAYIALPIGMASFYIAHFVLKDDLGFVKLHWLHVVGLNFLWMVSIMMVVRYLKPLESAFVQNYTEQVEVTEWKYVKHASWTVIGLLALLYTVFSNIGILGNNGSLTKVLLVLALFGMFCFVIRKIWLSKTSQSASSLAESQ